MSSPYVCKWGILACGGIAQQFAKDILSDPSKRGASDVRHEIVAVSSSTSVTKAQDFIKKTGCTPETKAYGSYEEFVKDPNIDIIYIATPHTFHYENTLLCLEAGKNVCCEKPFTINANHTAHLIKIARKKNLFLMEAVWTRFVPAVQEVLRLIHSEKILGNIIRVYSDLSEAFPEDPKSRLFDPALGGGALLDLGIYPLTWQLMTLYEHPDNQGSYPDITSSFLKSPLTGVDETTVVIGNYPKLRAQGIATTTVHVPTSQAYCVLIQGEKGDIRIPSRPQNPEQFYIELRGKEPELREFPIPGHGLFYEADAAARGLRDGKKVLPECDPEKHSLVAMKIMDQVRAAGGFRYPEAIEAVRE